MRQSAPFHVSHRLVPSAFNPAHFGRYSSLGGRHSGVRCGAQQQRAVFDAVGDRLRAQPDDGNDLQMGWVSRLRGAMARCKQTSAAFGDHPQTLSRWRAMSDALSVVERMCEPDRMPPPFAASIRHDDLWLAFEQSQRLCRAQMQQLRPQATVPAPQAVHRLLVQVHKIQRRSWPPTVRGWLARLSENLQIYIMSEADHRRGIIPPSLICAAIFDVLGCLTPPADLREEDRRLPASIVATWEAERDKPGFTTARKDCHDTLVLRRAELNASTSLSPAT